MEKETFINNFRRLLVRLDDLTRSLYTNHLSINYKFILEPSDRATSDHLTQIENDYLTTWNALQGKQITFDEVVDLLFKDGKTTRWADCSIYHSTNDLTVVKILFSRQFRDEKEIYYLENGTGPFKPVVIMPSQRSSGDKKFDVNWKKNHEERKKRNLWAKIKNLLKTA